VDERERRIAQNEALFRLLNAELEKLERDPDRKRLVCECGDIGCAETIELGHEEYRHVRADPTTFAVRPGHVEPDLEEVVEHCSGYDIVRKKGGAAAALVAREDPGPL
jgi:hypothetical protein